MTQKISTHTIDNSVRQKIVSCLSQQVSEYELLQSMYPNQGEIILPDKNILKDIYNFINKKSECIPSHLDFTLNLFIDKLKLELCINLPTEYPEEEPDIYLRCNQLNRQQESELNSKLTGYIKQIYIKGELCLYTIISWIPENIEDIKTEAVPITCEAPTEKDKSVVREEKFQRIWVYSHHIYNKKKREDIVKKAKELHICGFSLPGKPGVICVEGDSSSCVEWWKAIKSMSWQKIMIRKTEIFHATEANSVRKFSSFTELNLKMGDFSKYMSDLGFSLIFNEFFGLGSES
ncbi:hypothetical protein K1T71_005045 [Dendrolimus kikuchii]|uniref:Uncharacterized protein n=1 Tax=Dendrolimus kikuchii TaxID=765133 RepID=A0ACC1D5Y4_9NEOP|nr:hypothetical protein K1T71_005045 [Dendrolimus kikuchii]